MIKKSFWIFVLLSLVASALNYIAYPIFSRILEASEYVNITVSLSLFTQLAALLSSIAAITIGITKSNGEKKGTEIIETLQGFLFKLFMVIALIFLLFSPIIMKAIHTPVLFAVPISVMMLLSIPILIVSGYFNGKNQIIQLGFVALISALSQFAVGITTALISHSGILTMLSMTFAQITAIALIYIIFSSTKLPNIVQSLRTPLRIYQDPAIKSLLLYTALAAITVMGVSLAQIADLFVMQGIASIDVKFYTDIYTISRIVFFAGMIFIWPFLGEISIKNAPLNQRPLLKIIITFSILSLGTILALLLFGDTITYVMFGVHYSLTDILNVGIPSILYKLSMLIITAIVLYFIVLRRSGAFIVGLGASLVIFLVVLMTSPESNAIWVLYILNITAGTFAAFGFILALKSTRGSSMQAKHNLS